MVGVPECTWNPFGKTNGELITNRLVAASPLASGEAWGGGWGEGFLGLCLGWGAGGVVPIKGSSIIRCALFVRQPFLLLQNKPGPAGIRPETASGGDVGTQGGR